MENQKLNIALPILSFLPNLGGMEVGLHNLANQLVQKGHNPIVITSFSIYKKIKKLNYRFNYEIKYFPPGVFTLFKFSSTLGNYYFKQIFKNFNKKYNFDVWHLTSAYPLGISYVRYSKDIRIPYILRCVGEDIQIDNSINYGYANNQKNKKLIKKYLPQAQNLVATSKSVEECYKKYNVLNSKIHKIPNGVLTKSFDIKINQSLERKKLGLRSEALTLISVGRNHKKKNFKAIIDIAKILREQFNIDFQFIIVGRGVSDLRKEVKKLNLEKYIFLIEEKKIKITKDLTLPSLSLIKLYKISDIFIFPSIIETFGVVIIEAMAAGLPVIAHKVEGSKDLVKNNHNGFLIENDSNNIKNFVDKIIKLSKEKLKIQMSQNCIHSAVKFDWVLIADKYIKLYQKIISRKI